MRVANSLTATNVYNTPKQSNPTFGILLKTPIQQDLFRYVSKNCPKAADEFQRKILQNCADNPNSSLLRDALMYDILALGSKLKAKELKVNNILQKISFTASSIGYKLLSLKCVIMSSLKTFPHKVPSINPKLECKTTNRVA